MRAPRFLVVLLATILGGTLTLRAQSAAPSILGRWHGTSICVKASWNAACHDEEVIYDFTASPTRRDGVVLTAYKIVNGAPEPMGDLEFTWNATIGQWTGDFSNSRVRIRWHFALRGDSLIGGVTDLKENREGRHAAVGRANSPGR